MKRPTYQQQFDKITEAYIKGEIRPMSMNFCFCGTLAEGVRYVEKSQSEVIQAWESAHYTTEDFSRMERALMIELKALWTGTGWSSSSHNPSEPDYEDRLFNGMCAALEVLKQIHIESGEIIDEASEFKKRKLQTT